MHHASSSPPSITGYIFCNVVQTLFFSSIARHAFIIIADPEQVMYASIAVT
jgi:hypothetical protein